jgi:hypothetical protein
MLSTSSAVYGTGEREEGRGVEQGHILCLSVFSKLTVKCL